MIIYNFYISGHEKSLCDSHIGIDKQYVHQKAKVKDMETINHLVQVLMELKKYASI